MVVVTPIARDLTFAVQLYLHVGTLYFVTTV